jgi:hypothetical protein
MGWFVLGFIWAGYIALAFAIYNTHPQGAGDFDAYISAARRLVEAQPLYIGDNWYIYPPLLAQMLAPLAAMMDNRAAANLWFVVSVAALLVALWGIARAFPPAGSTLWSGTLIFIPVFLSLWLGQVTPVMFALIVGAWFAYRNGSPRIAGVLLALVIWFKFYPALLLVYFAYRRAWDVVVSAIVATVALVALQIALGGWETFVGYFTEVLPPLAAEGKARQLYANQSLLGFAQRMFLPSPQTIPLVASPLLQQGSYLVLTALVVGGTALALLRSERQSDLPAGRFDLEYALVLQTALLLGSILWDHGMLPLLLPYAILLHHRRDVRTPLLCLLSALLIGAHLFIMLGVLKPPSQNTLPALALSLPFFGALLVWAMTALALYFSPLRSPRSLRAR